MQLGSLIFMPYSRKRIVLFNLFVKSCIYIDIYVQVYTVVSYLYIELNCSSVLFACFTTCESRYTSVLQFYAGVRLI